MKAAYIEQVGPPENIVYGDLPEPEPTAAQVLVRVKAVAVNPIDAYIRSGAVKMELPRPFVVGCDLAGVVEKCGPDAQRFKPGRARLGQQPGIDGPPGNVCRVRRGRRELALSDAGGRRRRASGGRRAGRHHVASGTVPLRKLAAGEILFVNGGSGGVGSTVVQMAKAVGARAITTAGSAEKVEVCRSLGADLAINYKTEDVDAAIRKFAPGGVNVWWETLREPDFERTVPLLAQRGRMIVMAGRDARPVFPVGPFYVKDCSLFGFAMFNATPDEQRACSADINQWLAGGQLKPRIDRVLPLADAAQAHRLQEDNTLNKAGTLAGKIVLTP